MKTTIAIPARNEIFLNRTIQEIYDKARGDIEVFVGMDGTWELPLPEDRDNLTIMHWNNQRGHREIVNAASVLGTGDYIMKIDSHCALDEGFDLKLAESCDVDWVSIPTRYSLEFFDWKPYKKAVNYEYIRYPYDQGNWIGTTAVPYWRQREKARANYTIDDDMICQGSLMFMPMRYFRDLIYPMDTTNYGPYNGEQFEICMKVWLSGGRVVVNKNTWYAHLYKGNAYKDYYNQIRGVPFISQRAPTETMHKGIQYQQNFWFGNRWEKRIHDFEWLVDKFWPIPGWPEERTLWTRTA